MGKALIEEWHLSQILTFIKQKSKHRALQVRVQHKQRQEDVTIHQVGLVHTMLGRTKASKPGWPRPRGSMDYML